MPRLFIGLEIPAALASDLALLRGGLSGARWIDVENYHLTLRFIGDIDEAMAADVYSILGQVRRAPFIVSIDELGSFGGDKPRAIVAKAKPTPALVELQAEIERLMRRLGLPGEARKFVPHVTLARLRGASALAVADYLSLRAILSRRFEAARFVVFSSRDSVGGGPYVTEATYPLIEASARRHA